MPGKRQLDEERWMEQYAKVVDYKATTGSTRVPKLYGPDPPLGRWVSLQRKRRKENKLTAHRCQLLDQINFVWEVPNEDALWQERYEELVAYHEAHGHTRIKQKEGRVLGRWCKKQKEKLRSGSMRNDRKRRLYEIGFIYEPHHDAPLIVYDGQQHQQPSSSTGDGVGTDEQPTDADSRPNKKRARLDPKNDDENDTSQEDDAVVAETDHAAVAPAAAVAIEEEDDQQQDVDPPPNKATRDEQRWMEQYERLRAYQEMHGTTNVASGNNHTPGFLGLGNWVAAQRQRIRKGKLLPNRRELLDQLGFSWKPSQDLETNWMQKYEQLQAFNARNGHTLVPYRQQHRSSGSNNSDEYKLSRWVIRQRDQYRSGALPTERRQLLEAIGFVWSPPIGGSHRKLDDSRWMGQYEKLKTYRRTVGDTLVPCNYPDKNLAVWVQMQRTNLKSGKLRPDRQHLLDQLQFAYEATRGPANDGIWMQQYTKLVQYKRKYGHTLVPVTFTTNEDEDPSSSSLGSWVQAQRTCNRLGKMRQDRKNLLIEIDFAWVGTNAVQERRQISTDRRLAAHRV